MANITFETIDAYSYQMFYVSATLFTLLAADCFDSWLKLINLWYTSVELLDFREACEHFHGSFQYFKLYIQMFIFRVYLLLLLLLFSPTTPALMSGRSFYRWYTRWCDDDGHIRTYLMIHGDCMCRAYIYTYVERILNVGYLIRRDDHDRQERRC